MTLQTKIAAYSALLDQINATIDRIDQQMVTIVREYKKMVALHDTISSDLEQLIAPMLTGKTNCS